MPADPDRLAFERLCGSEPFLTGIGGRDGGQIGAGVVRAPMECFTQAAAALDAA